MTGSVSCKGLAAVVGVLGIVAAATVVSMAPSFAAETPLEGAKNAYCYKNGRGQENPERYLVTNPRLDEENRRIYWEMEFQRWDGSQYVTTQGKDNPYQHDGNPWTGGIVLVGFSPADAQEALKQSNADEWCDAYVQGWPKNVGGSGDWA